MRSNLNIPIGRVEFLGQVLHIVECDGRLVAACPDESGMPYEILAAPRVDVPACRDLMWRSMDLLFETSELALQLTAFAAERGTATGSNNRPECSNAETCRKPDGHHRANVSGSKRHRSHHAPRDGSRRALRIEDYTLEP
jgi:hypothetical protein